ncbi:MAG: DUF1598 domain-containing protein [Pirellulaceae bacterium]|nr:DUF1598 domain-containing protein [Pirellulaceae bacterium]
MRLVLQNFRSPAFPRLASVCAACCFVVLSAASALSQLPSGGDTGNSSAGNSGASTAAIPGGGVVADFDTLMNLIQQTIDPDSWLQAGGTNTINPYPAGVYVDPKGYMRRMKESGQLPVNLRLATSSSPKHPWRRASKLRTVSLKQLDASLAATRESGLQPSIDLLKVAGLSRITYVKVLADEEDILIAGPAGENEHGFLLEDLATVAAMINQQTTPMGCSIEPTNEGILAAQQMLQERGALDRLARNPKLLVEQMQDKVGAHNVSVFGLPAHCSTALALVDADEHMKRVGFGTVKTTPYVKSYFDFLDEQSAIPNQSLVRWWFAFSDEPILANGANQMFQLPDNVVSVLSEQQRVSQNAERAPTGGNDSSADKFAKELTRSIPELRKTLPTYARLCGVFEAGLALQVALEINGEPNLRAWFPNLCNLGRSLCETPTIASPKTVEGLTTWHRLKSGTTVAVVSGGVKIDLQAVAGREHWKDAKFLAPSAVPTQAAVPTTAHSQWWWD